MENVKSKRPRTLTPEAVEDSNEDELYFVHTRKKSRVESEKVVFIEDYDKVVFPRRPRESVSIYQKVNVKRQDIYQTKRFRKTASRTSPIDDSDDEPQFENSWPPKEAYVALLSDTESEDFELDIPEIYSGLSSNSITPFTERNGPLFNRRARILHMNQKVLKHLVEPKATRLIRAMAGGLFNRDITIVGPDDTDSPIDINCEPAKAAQRRQDSWKLKDYRGARNTRFIGEAIWEDAGEGTTGYESCTIDDTTYQPGDFILMRARKINDRLSYGEQGDSSDSPSSGDEDDFELPWFGRIVYLFKDEQLGDQFHMEYYEHGGSTILGEFAGPHELFRLGECTNQAFICITGKIKVELIDTADEQPVSEVVETRFKDPNYFFCRFHYDHHAEKFTDAKQTGKLDGKTCGPCAEKLLEAERTATEVISGVSRHAQAFTHEGIIYRLHDFAYAKPSDGSLSKIVQIMEIDYRKSGIILMLQHFHRFDKKAKWFEQASKGQEHPIRDNRRLILCEKLTLVAPTVLEGKCCVRNISQIKDLETYKDEDDTFWVQEKCVEYNCAKIAPLRPLELKYSDQTDTEAVISRAEKEHFLARGQKIKTMELFSGAGGIAQGLHLSGAVETKWAVEFAPCAVVTFKRNFPSAIVYNEDTNNFLERAIKQYVGSKAGSETDFLGDPIKDAPNRGEVDMIVAGFPCPGYSRLNRAPKANDIKNTAILPTLSLIDFYRPRYVLLENVANLTKHKLGAMQLDGYRTGGGIEQGTLKFILRVLTCLGYQTEHAVLQAGEYGMPQPRQRLIIWAARQGYELPSYPQPTTVFTGGRCPNSWHRSRNSAPYPEVTVGDAITDLPAFDWVNPHKIRPRTNGENDDRLLRAVTTKQIRILPNQDYVGRDNQEYSTQPLSSFQRWLRKGVTTAKVSNHITPAWFDEPRYKETNNSLMRARTEQVCSIPIVPGADHKDLPQELKSWYMYHHDSQAKENNYYPGRFGRLDYNGSFQTCLTTFNLSGDNGNIVHPSQHRVLSIREFARAQGFPDSFTWDLKNTKIKFIYREIGNAVPVPLAEALGKELLKVLVKEFIAKEKMKEEDRTEDVVGEGSKNQPVMLDVEDAVEESGKAEVAIGGAGNPILLED